MYSQELGNKEIQEDRCHTHYSLIAATTRDYLCSFGFIYSIFLYCYTLSIALALESPFCADTAGSACGKISTSDLMSDL